MNTIEAVIILQKLESTNLDIIPLPPETIAGTSINPVKKLVQQGKVLFVYVKKDDLITYLKTKHNLVKKGNELRNILDVHRAAGGV